MAENFDRHQCYRLGVRTYEDLQDMDPEYGLYLVANDMVPEWMQDKYLATFDVDNWEE